MSKLEKPSTLSVLIAEDHLLFSEGLKTFLQNTHKFSSVWQARNGLEAVELAKTEKPSIILMDIQMPEMDGLQAALLIKQAVPESKIIMLTSFTDTNSVKRALSAGVEGYCSKEIDPNRLISVIEMISSGSIYLDPMVADFVLKHYFLEEENCPKKPAIKDSITDTAFEENILSAIPAIEPKNDFTAQTEVTVQPIAGQVLKGRELEILALIANNMDHEEIAEALHISIDWVNSYIKSILQKLAVDDEWQAVKKAIADGAIRKIQTVE